MTRLTNWIFKEMGEFGSGLCALVCLLQLVPGPFQSAGDALHGSRNREPHLDDSEIDCGMKMSEAPVLEYKKPTVA